MSVEGPSASPAAACAAASASSRRDGRTASACATASTAGSIAALVFMPLRSSPIQPGDTLSVGPNQKSSTRLYLCPHPRPHKTTKAPLSRGPLRSLSVARARNVTLQAQEVPAFPHCGFRSPWRSELRQHPEPMTDGSLMVAVRDGQLSWIGSDVEQRGRTAARRPSSPGIPVVTQSVARRCRLCTDAARRR